MTEKKYSFFPPSGKEDWIEAAKSELEGIHPFDKPAFSKDGIPILPYYDQGDTKDKNRVLLAASDNPFLGPRAWLNLAPVSVMDSETANKTALSYLSSGADGILFDLNEDFPAAALLRNIELPFCGVAILVGPHQVSFIEGFLKYVNSKENYLESLSGALFWKSEPKNLKGIIEELSKSKHFYANGITGEELPAPADEISSLLAKAVKRIDNLTDQGLDIKKILSATSFSLPIQTDFFFEIAKFKALRLLWSQLSHAYDKSFESPVFIHGYSPAWIKTAYQPHGNMIKSTTAGLSAVLGGCDGVSIMAEDSANPLSNRIARNVSSILREESHLSQVADPTAGSYYIESLTDQFAQEAWSKFQKLVTV
jgi:methylmalonyl-CoA mutase